MTLLKNRFSLVECQYSIKKLHILFKVNLEREVIFKIHLKIIASKIQHFI